MLLHETDVCWYLFVPVKREVVGYVRVSTDEQADSGAGLEAQRTAIRVECARRGWNLIAIHEDAASARTLAARPGLAAALQAIEANGASALIVAKLAIAWVLLRPARAVAAT